MSATDKESEERRKQRAGLSSLGMVMPREETPAPFGDLPLSAQATKDSKIDLSISTLACNKCGTFFVPGAKFCSECGARRPSEDILESANGLLTKSAKEKDPNEVLEEVKRAKEKLAKEHKEAEAKKKSKKKKRKKSKDEFQKAGDRESEWEDDDDEDEEEHLSQLAKDEWRQRRDGGAYKKMVVENIKGMVSNVNKGFTDADLERRFAPQQSRSNGSLMSEEEARALVKRERTKKGEPSVSASTRAQREAAEWAEKKKFEQSRRRSREREHLVVGRR